VSPNFRFGSLPVHGEAWADTLIGAFQIGFARQAKFENRSGANVDFALKSEETVLLCQDPVIAGSTAGNVKLPS